MKINLNVSLDEVNLIILGLGAYEKECSKLRDNILVEAQNQANLQNHIETERQESLSGVEEVETKKVEEIGEDK